MERITCKILFYIKKTRVAKNGEVPALLRVTVKGVRAETSVNLKVNPKVWNAVAGKSIRDTPKDEELNHRIDTIRLRIMQIYREMDKVEITARGIIDKYLGRDTKPKIMLLDVFSEHNDRCQKLSDAGKDMAAASVVRYETTLKHVDNFIKHTYGMDVQSMICRIIVHCDKPVEHSLNILARFRYIYYIIPHPYHKNNIFSNIDNIGNKTNSYHSPYFYPTHES